MNGNFIFTNSSVFSSPEARSGSSLVPEFLMDGYLVAVPSNRLEVHLIALTVDVNAVFAKFHIKVAIGFDGLQQWLERPRKKIVLQRFCKDPRVPES